MVGENTFLKEGNSSDIVCYSNANWAGYKAQVRSISGYCMFHGDNLAASRRMWWVDPVESIPWNAQHCPGASKTKQPIKGIKSWYQRTLC